MPLCTESWVGGICAVIRSTDNTMWYKDGGGNFAIPVPSKQGRESSVEASGDVFARLPDDLCRAIAESEQTHMWTLMHR